MAVDVSRIPNNNKFDPVREAILQLQTDIEDTGNTIGNGTLTIGTSGTLSGSATFTANQSSNTTITIGIDDSDYLSLSDTGEQTIAGDIVISGDLTVSGSTITKLSEEVLIEDAIIVLNSNEDGTPTENAGIEIERGTSTNKTFLWNETSDKWTLGSETLVAGTFEGNLTGDVTGDLTGTVTVGSVLAIDSSRNADFVDVTAAKLISDLDDSTYIDLENGRLRIYVDSNVKFDTNLTYLTTLDVPTIEETLTAGNEASTDMISSERIIFTGDTKGIILKEGLDEYWGIYHTHTGDKFILRDIQDSADVISIPSGGAMTLTPANGEPVNVTNNLIVSSRIGVGVTSPSTAIDVSGTVTATNFIGDGSQLTNLPGGSLDLQDVTDNGASTTNDISTGRITIANNVSTGGFGSFDDYQILLYKDTTANSSYGLGIESNTMMFHSNDKYRFYVNNSIKATINSSGNITASSFTGNGSGLTSVDADTLDSYQLSGTSSVSDKIFNNKGNVHSTYTNFNTVMNAGPNYLQGGTNGPTGTASHQWYGFMLGLGSDYGTSTGTTGDYASQLYWNRQSQGSNPYLWARDMESGTWSSWRKMSAGYADNAGTLNGVAGSNFLRSDQDDTASGEYTFVAPSNNVGDAAIRIKSSDTSDYGRLYFDSSSTVAGVINRTTSSADLYFDEPSTTGKYFFRSSGRAVFYGSMSIGTTEEDNLLNVRKDQNTGSIAYLKNLYTGTSSYAEIIVRSVDSDNDLRIGSSKNYGDSQWVGGWVFAPRKLLLKSNDDVNVFAGGTANSDIVATFAGSSISLNQSTEVTGKVTITGSPAIDFTGSGTGTYNKTVIYNDQTYGFLVEGTKATNSGSAAKKPITLTWRGGYSSNGGLQLTGDTKLYTNDTGLGIGTTSPSQKLDVQGSQLLNGSLYLINTNTRISSDANGEVGINYASANTSTYSLSIYNSTTRAIGLGRTGDAYFSGNVGIGTTDTPLKLNVRGGFIALNSANGSSNSALYISPTNENTFNSGYGQDVDNKDMWLNYRGYNDGFTRFRDLRIGNGKGSAFAFFQGSTQRVGIGTTSPSAKLNVVGGVTVDANGIGNTVHVWDDSASGQPGFIVTNTGTQATSTHTLYLKNYGGNINANVFGTSIASKSIVASADGGNGLLFGTISNTPIYVGTNDVLAMIVDTSQRVGIGTTTPGAKLEVNGYAAVGRYGAPHYSQSGMAYQVIRATGSGSERAMLEIHSGNQGTKGIFQAVGVNNTVYFGSLTSSNVSVGNNVEAFYFNTSGNVGLGTTSPSAKFQVQHNGDNGSSGSSDYAILANASSGQATIGAIHTAGGYSNLNLGSSGSGSGLEFWHISYRQATQKKLEYYWYSGGSFDSKFEFLTNGNFKASGDVVAYSDARLKENVETIDNALDKVLAMRGVSYNRIADEDKSRKIGVIAQEVEQVLPEVVSQEGDGMKSVAYGNIVGVLIEAIKEQQKQIDELKARLDGSTK